MKRNKANLLYRSNTKVRIFSFLALLDQVDIKISFGKRVRQIRLSRKMTQLDLSVRTDTDISQIGRIERGEISTSVTFAGKLAMALNVPLKDLFEFDQ